MVGFLDVLQQELKKAESVGEKTEFPASKLKHDMVYLSKKNTEEFVRILPPMNHGENFAVLIREAMYQARNMNGKDLRPSFVLGEYPNPDSILDQAITQWIAEERVPNSFGRTTAPSKRALINVRRMVQDPSTGNYVEERDEHGNPVTRMMKLPISAYTSILHCLSQPMLQPQGSDEYGFISELASFPVVISKVPNDNKYAVQVTPNIPLPALEPNWRDTLEDLKYQATPSEEYDRDFVEYFISVVNHTEGTNSGNSANEQAPTQQQFSQPTQQAQPQFSQPVQQQQPMQQQQPVQQAQPQFNQPVQQAQPQFSQPVQQQPVQQQPVQQQQFSQPVQQEQPVQQQQGQPMQQQEQPMQQGQPAGSGVLPSVDDLLKQFS